MNYYDFFEGIVRKDINIYKVTFRGPDNYVDSVNDCLRRYKNRHDRPLPENKRYGFMRSSPVGILLVDRVFINIGGMVTVVLKERRR